MLFLCIQVKQINWTKRISLILKNLWMCWSSSSTNTIQNTLSFIILIISFHTLFYHLNRFAWCIKELFLIISNKFIGTMGLFWIVLTSLRTSMIKLGQFFKIQFTAASRIALEQNHWQKPLRWEGLYSGFFVGWHWTDKVLFEK